MRAGAAVALLLPWVACGQRGTLATPEGKRLYTRADTLLGCLRPARTAWDVVHYALEVTLYPQQEALKGQVTCTFRWLGGSDVLQLDLAQELTLKEIQVDGAKVSFRREPGTRAIWVKLPPQARQWPVGSLHTWRAAYQGKPRKAPLPPWDGGLVWSRTPDGQPWIGVACQGLGASLWWPLKDHLSDEPDSVSLTFCVPPPLRVIANGQPAGQFLRHTDTCFVWRVTYPINTYNVTFYAAPSYIVQEDTFHSLSGEVVPLRFALLQAHADKVAYLAEQSKKVLRAYEHYFGPFPVPRDGFGLVESPYYGMEHQSAIAYGNRFRLDRTWGFDYIILHETGHEWWGNHVTAADNADLWIQEGFCTYGESLFIEYYQGYSAAVRYLVSQRGQIQNRFPVQGPYCVNADQTRNTDIYYKTAWMLHTLRSRVANDSLWLRCLRALQDSFSFRTVSRAEIVAFMGRQLNQDLEPFFRAYLDHLRPPVLSYRVVQEGEKAFLLARWICEEPAFAGPMEFLAGDKRLRFELTQQTQRFPLPEGVKEVLPDRSRFLVVVTEEP